MKTERPADFMFQLNVTEFENWKSQIVTSNPGAVMGLRKRPYAFTEHGVAMLSSVLRRKRADPSALRLTWATDGTAVLARPRIVNDAKYRA